MKILVFYPIDYKKNFYFTQENQYSTKRAIDIWLVVVQKYDPCVYCVLLSGLVRWIHLTEWRRLLQSMFFISVAQTDHWSIANTNSSNLSSVLILL